MTRQAIELVGGPDDGATMIVPGGMERLALPLRSSPMHLDSVPGLSRFAAAVYDRDPAGPEADGRTRFRFRTIVGTGPNRGH